MFLISTSNRNVFTIMPLSPSGCCSYSRFDTKSSNIKRSHLLFPCSTSRITNSKLIHSYCTQSAGKEVTRSLGSRLGLSVPAVLPYLRLMRATAPIGTWLLLWPCYWSAALASHSVPDLKLLALFGVGAFVMRGAGCTINDLIDRDFDKQVTRTRNRPLASGELSVRQAVAFLALQLSVGLAVLVQLNLYSIIIGAASLCFVGVYPFMKRITYWPQAFLGLTFNWGAFVGYSAVAGYCDWRVVLPLYLGGLAWTICYDTIYAHQDKEDDKHIGVKSTALLFGDKTRTWLNYFAIGCTGSLMTAGYFANEGWPFYVGMLAAYSHLVWQIRMVDLDNRADCMAKFVSNKWFGAIVFSSILLGNMV